MSEVNANVMSGAGECLSTVGAGDERLRVATLVPAAKPRLGR